MSETPPPGLEEIPSPREIVVPPVTTEQMAKLATQAIGNLGRLTMQQGVEFGQIGFWSNNNGVIDAEVSETIRGTATSVEASLNALLVPGHPAVVIHTHPPGSIDKLSLQDIRNAQLYWGRGSRSLLDNKTDLVGDMPVIVVACPDQIGVGPDDLSLAVLIVNQVPGKPVDFGHFLNRMEKHLPPSHIGESMLLSVLDNRPVEIGETGLCMLRTILNPNLPDATTELIEYMQLAMPRIYQTKPVNIKPTLPRNFPKSGN